MNITMEKDMNYAGGSQLRSLKSSDFEVAENEPNILGWTIKDQEGRKIGEVDDLIFDPESRKVRYIVMDLEGNVLDLEPRDVLVPIGIAQLHTSDDDVILPGVTADHLRALPLYEEGRLTRDSESKVMTAFSGLGAAGTAGNDFYSHEHFDEERAYRNRQKATGDAVPIIKEEMNVGKTEVETGATRLKTRIVEKPAKENLTLREEHVKVERNPVNRPVTDADTQAFKEGEIEIKERAEIPVVGKEARVVEEINLNKEVTEREATIEGTVRNTEVKVETRKNPNLPDQNMPPNQNPPTGNNQNPNPNSNPNPNPNPNQ
jgi:stress response protein YsnF